MPHSQGLSNNSYPEPNQPNSHIDRLHISLRSILILSSLLRLGLPKDLFPESLIIFNYIIIVSGLLIQLRNFY